MVGMHSEHRDVAPLLVCPPIWLVVIFKLGHDAPDALAIEECEEGVVGPLLHKVPVGVDRVRLRQFLLNKSYDQLQVLLTLEGAELHTVCI
jgi:hypothetical protein